MDLYERQQKLEQEYTNEGIAAAMRKYEEDLASGRMADTNVGRAFTIRTFSLVRDALVALRANKTRGLGGKYRSLLHEVGDDICAVIAIRTVLGLLGKTYGDVGMGRMEPIVQTFLSEAGPALEAEHILAKLKLAAPGYMHRVVQSMDENRTSSVNHRRRTLLASAENVQVGSENVLWGNAEREGCSKLLLEVLVTCGIIELAPLAKGRGQNWVAIRATEAVSEHLGRMTSLVRAFTRFPPMLVPPTPHTRETLFRGASYLTPGLNNLTGTLKLRSRRKDHRGWIAENVSDLVLATANKAAQQPYRIDVETAQLLRGLYSQGVWNGIAGIPSNTPVPLPVYPLAADWNREDPKLVEQHDAWKAEARQAYGDEIVRKSHVMAFSQTMRYLREFADDTLYFPTYYDWRGRLYFRSRINPQGADFVKAVLQFANKKPLGKAGLYWLKVHVATCYGFDKRGFDSRVVWTDENMPLIRQAVADTVDSDFFRAADSHWCFYVAARELCRALDSGSPETWESGVPVAMDATCSGMQHLSALLRDPVGGMFTNLLPNHGDEKEDIYAGVAAVAISNIQKDRDNIEPAQYWIEQGVARSDAKRPVMTYVYGGTLQSCTEYVYLGMKERDLPGTELYSQFKLAAYLSKHLRKGIESAVPSAAEAMRFLRELAGKMPGDEAMRWITPAGFPVVQFYAKEETVRIYLDALGVNLNMTRYDETQLNRLRTVNGIAPNFVHSLDSAHLVRVINAFPGEIVPIHDSFATHAADVQVMHNVLREEFVRMYTEYDPLGTLVAGVQEHTDEELLAPTRGKLDLERVLESQFFMC